MVGNSSRLLLAILSLGAFPAGAARAGRLRTGPDARDLLTRGESRGGPSRPRRGRGIDRDRGGELPPFHRPARAAVRTPNKVVRDAGGRALRFKNADPEVLRRPHANRGGDGFPARACCARLEIGRNSSRAGPASFGSSAMSTRTCGLISSSRTRPGWPRAEARGRFAFGTSPRGATGFRSGTKWGHP